MAFLKLPSGMPTNCQQWRPPACLVPRRTSVNRLRRGVRVRAEGSSFDNSWDANNSSDNSSITLSAHRTWLRRQRVLQSEPHPSDSDIIELNVGGSIMVTSRSTLRQVSGSLLAVLFDPANHQLLMYDAAGRVFLDHDPATFGLVLRYLRELKVTGGCTSSVVLPPIPPADAPAFKHLVAHLGLQLDESAITAATARGVAITAAGAHIAGSMAVRESPERPVSPYASRPAVSSSPDSYFTQQQWLLRQQQQHLVRSQLSGTGQSGHSCSSSSSSTGPTVWAPSRDGHSVSASSHSHVSNPNSQDTPSSSAHAVQDQQYHHQAGSEAQSQYYYLRTSSAVNPLAADAAGQTSNMWPFKVTIHTESDMQAKEQQLQELRQHNSIIGSDSSSAINPNGIGLESSGCDVFCSVSSSKQALTLSVVARGSAGVDDMFLGATSASHTDQRGLQIPCFGWRQFEVWGHEGLPSAGQHSKSSFFDSLGHTQISNIGHHQQLWQTGDLVQLVLDLSSPNRLMLKVNGQEVPECYNMLQLPTFRQWCWYLALFRGTDVVAVVFEKGSYSIYSGDQKLTRFVG